MASSFSSAGTSAVASSVASDSPSPVSTTTQSPSLSVVPTTPTATALSSSSVQQSAPQSAATSATPTTNLASTDSATTASPSSSPSSSTDTPTASTMSSSGAATTSQSAATSQSPASSAASSASSSNPTTEQTSSQSTVASSQSTDTPTTIPSTSAAPSTSASPSSDTLSSSPSSSPTTSSPTPSSSPAPTTGSSSSTSSSTVLAPIATVTGSTTVYVTTTNVQGQTITSAPSVVTQVLTSTNGVGAVTTVTAAVVNPTLAPNNATTDATSFFNNTGAVVGVFVVVGLAVASILLWILFAARRRYRMRQIEHESAIQAAVAAAGFNRTPLDDDDDNGHTRSPHSHSQYSEMGQRGSYAFSSLPTAGPPLYDDIHGGFNPYADYPMIPQANRGYVPARTASPPPGAERPAPSAIGTGTEDLGSTRDRKSSYGHTPTYSAGSFEPLLSNYAQNPDPLNPPPTPPPRNPQRLIDASNPRDRTTSSASFPSPDNEHPLNVGVDNRLDPDVGRLTRSNSLGTAAIRDNEDYSRPILTVRNIPDTLSEHSS